MPDRMPSDQIVQLSSSPPVSAEGVPASTFLNLGSQSCCLQLLVDHSLGVVSRIMLVINRRGLAIEELRFRKLPSGCLAHVELCFCGDSEQIKLIRNDLLKLYDLVQLTAVQENDPSTYRGGRHELEDLSR